MPGHRALDWLLFPSGHPDAHAAQPPIGVSLAPRGLCRPARVGHWESEGVIQPVGVYDLIQAILEDRKPVLSAEQARHVIEIMNKCYIAAREGCTLPLETTF